MRRAGFGPFGIAVGLAGLSFATGLIAAITLLLHLPQILLVLAFILLCLGYYWLTSQHERAVDVFRWLRRVPTLSLNDELHRSKETGH